VKLTTDLYQVPSLRISGAIPPFLYMPLWRVQEGFTNRDTAVTVVTRLRVVLSGCDCTFLQNDQTGFAAHAASCAVGTWNPFPGGKVAEA
jgi:hypothetical protein